MQNSQDFHLPIATLTTGKEIGPGPVCAPRELVTISQNVGFLLRSIRKKHYEKPSTAQACGGLSGEQKSLKIVFTGKELHGQGPDDTVNVIPAYAGMTKKAAVTTEKIAGMMEK
jgi:hypothetical protein